MWNLSVSKFNCKHGIVYLIEIFGKQDLRLDDGSSNGFIRRKPEARTESIA
jgi:hypothetical protein